jgi:hypothetical protein
LCCWKMIRFFNWIGRVIIGWWNVITKNETSEAKRRYEICMQCDKKIKIGGEWVCSQCGCFLRAKSRSPKEKCLLNKW